MIISFYFYFISIVEFVTKKIFYLLYLDMIVVGVHGVVLLGDTLVQRDHKRTPNELLRRRRGNRSRNSQQAAVHTLGQSALRLRAVLAFRQRVSNVPKRRDEAQLEVLSAESVVHAV